MVFAKLTDLRNLENFKDNIPADANISDMECKIDSIQFTVNPVGKIGLRIVEKEEFKTIKFGAENSPIDFSLWIQLEPAEANETKLKITLKAKLPSMIKMMIGNKLQGFVDQMANGLTKIEY